MSTTRLSPLDDSFLATESATAHMHVGWAAVFEPPEGRPRPSFEELRRHIEGRLHRAPRYRQKLSPAPLDLDAPSWVDDEGFEPGRHLTRSPSGDLDQIIAECMSRQLDRGRPLWEIRIAERLDGGRIGLVGKVHHCMVDGVAAVELGLLLLDPTPEPPEEGDDRWRPEPQPDLITRLEDVAREKARVPVELARAALELVESPSRLRRAPVRRRARSGP